MYGKIFESMYDGTLRTCWQALVTFQQLIVLCDAEGVIDMTPHAIAGRTGIPLDIIEPGIQHLEAPDPYSRSPECEGRRLERLDSHRPWGWRIVNYRKYRDLISAEEKRIADRNRIAAKRAAERDSRDMSQPVADCREASQRVAPVAHTEAEAEVEVTSLPDARAREDGDQDLDDWPDGAGQGIADPIHDWRRVPGVCAAAFQSWLAYLAQIPKAVSPQSEVSMAKKLAYWPVDGQQRVIDLHVERGWKNLRNTVDLDEAPAAEGGRRLTRFERNMEALERA